jgi:hypothetical protein
MSALDKIKAWFGRTEAAVEDEAHGARPVATTPGDPDRETSTNAQMEGAVGEPYPDEK